jgi:DNA-binding XRE family transcriptional regulator
MAHLLGMSRQTLIKVEQGSRDLTKAELEILTTLEKTHKIETENQDNIRINIPQKNIAKFEEVLLYILQKVGAKPNVGMTVVYKLLYFIDFNFYEKYEKQLMSLTYFKNKKLEQVKSTYFHKEQTKFLPHVKPDLSVLTAQELEMIDDELVFYRSDEFSVREYSPL